MRRRTAACSIALSIVAGVGLALAIDAGVGRPSPGGVTPTQQPETTGATERASRVVGEPLGPVVPGAIEPVAVGMTVDQAEATGFITADHTRVDMCVGGSTLAQLREAYGSRLVRTTSQFDQPAFLLHSGQKWLAFLLETGTPDLLRDSSKVTFVEVTRGEPPTLVRDGCS